MIAAAGGARDAGAVLGPELAAVGGEAVHRAGQDVDGARAAGPAVGADGQVVEAVVVEVAARQREPEEVAALGVVGDAGAVLAPELAVTGGESARRPVDDVDDAGAAVLAVGADGQVVEPVM